MQLNVQMESAKNGGSEHSSSSDAEQLSQWNYEMMAMLKETSLMLEFSDEVAPVLTGEVLKGKRGDPMKVSLVDRTTGEVVTWGLQSSAEVEIFVLGASGDDNEHNWTLEKVKNLIIIKEGDKKRPHFPKGFPIYLNKGVGILDNVKFTQKSNWTKSCNCRLRARIMENFRGIEAQEAWTESFMVSDKRSCLYKKHHPPSLSDKVWRLERIGNAGKPCKRLKEENILSVQDFLILYSVDPQRLQKIVGARGSLWDAILDHAQTCIIHDKRIFSYYPSTGSKNGVIFDAVGRLKGVIQDSHYVPMNNLSDDEMDCAHKLRLSAFEIRKDKKLRLSAFENRKNITSFDDEASLLRRFPYRSSDINGYNSTDLGTSSQSISPTIATLDLHLPDDDFHFDSFGLPTNGEQQACETGLDVPKIPSCPNFDFDIDISEF